MPNSLSKNATGPLPAPTPNRAEAFAKTRALLAKLGDPQRGLPFIHVAGTNGKGSICALLDSILSASGLRVARYTSPHLESYLERISVSGRPISQTAFDHLLALVKAAGREVSPHEAYTEFQLLTATAFMHFSKINPDVVILEVGRGGRWDATNVIPAPKLAIISNVTLDHTEVLGSTVEAIATEKAGIIKEGTTVLTQAIGDAYQVIDRRARKLRARVLHVPVASYVSELPCGQKIGYRGKIWELGLIGTYQLRNAALVLEAVDRLRSEGMSLPEEAVRQGLINANWPGRMEVCRTSDHRVLLDGAHNPSAVVELAASLKRHFPGEEVVLVIGTLREKAGRQMLELLAPFAQTLFVTNPPSADALPAEHLAEGLLHSDVSVVPDPYDAIRRALAVAENRLVVVCGSLYLVGLARSLLSKDR